MLGFGMRTSREHMKTTQLLGGLPCRRQVDTGGRRERDTISVEGWMSFGLTIKNLLVL